VNLAHRLLALLFAAGAWFTSLTAAAEPLPATALTVLDVSALATATDRVYVGSFDAGVFVLERDGTMHAYSDPALNPYVNALAWSEREQVLWVGTARGLVRCPARGGCARIGTEASVHALLLSSSGSVIVGGDDGVSFVNGSALLSFGRKHGAPFRSVWALAEGDGRLFAGTTSGLFFGPERAFSGRGRTLGRAAVVLDTLPDDWVTALAYRGGRLFAGTYSAGVAAFRVDASGLEKDELDTSLGYVNPAGLALLDDGRLAVATMDGLRVGALGRTGPVATRARDVTAFVSAPDGFWIGTRSGLDFWTGTSSGALLTSSAARVPARAR
jgi:ligand-binding sensor domain-containing protein